MSTLYTAREIAELTGINFSTVRKRIQRLGLEHVEVRYGRRFYTGGQLERVRRNK